MHARDPAWEKITKGFMKGEDLSTWVNHSVNSHAWRLTSQSHWKKLPQSLNLPNGSRPYHKTKCENKIRPLTQRTTLFTTCTTPIMHLICPPKFCITFVFHFSWVLQPSSEKLKQCLCKMNNFATRLSQKHKRYSDIHKQIQCVRSGRSPQNFKFNWVDSQ